MSVCRQGLRAVRSCVLCQYLTGAEESNKLCVVSVTGAEDSEKLCVVSVCRQGLCTVRSCVLCEYIDRGCVQ